jgi:hypothetical protein
MKCKYCGEVINPGESSVIEDVHIRCLLKYIESGADIRKEKSRTMKGRVSKKGKAVEKLE